MVKPSVLIVEDEALLALMMEEDLTARGFPVVGTAATAEEAVSLALGERPAVILMDVRLRGRRDGIDAALEIYRSHPEIRVVFVTGSQERRTVDRIHEDHPAEVLFKPVAPADIAATILQVVA